MKTSVKTGIHALIASFILCAMPAAAWAAPKGSADEAIAMTKRAVAMIKADGKEKAFAAIADPANTSFHDRDLYIYVYDMNGVTLAHGNNHKMVGKNLTDLKDNEGKAIVKSLITTANSPAGRVWVDFRWPNPLTKVVEQKSGYIERVDNMIVGSGIYK